MKHETRDDLVDAPPIEQSRRVAGVSDLELDMCSDLDDLAPRALQNRLIGIYPDQHGRSRDSADKRQ